MPAVELPSRIRNVDQLKQLLSEPTPPCVEAIGQLDGDLLFLGAGGKMGLATLQMARRAADAAGYSGAIYAASRYSNPQVREELDALGIQTIAGDLLDADFVERLPDAAHVVSMVGHKFGTSSQPSYTWATNVYLPALLGQRFQASRIVAFSTGNVYPLVRPESAGCRETDPLGPVGEYAMSALGRERMYDYFSRQYEIPTALIRLNYACELRYGVLVDLAKQVAAGGTVDITVPYVNVIWQADASAMALAALSTPAVPPQIWNVAGPEILRVRDVCRRFAELFGVEIELRETDSPLSLLNDGRAAWAAFGPPRVPVDTLIEWIAAWISDDQPSFEKPTHFEVADGKF